jgi:diaminohydroxyphosphoribosylaminopyrimidine deaminase/5-amino-6-(5-phosphoribosylamino)uracil reductase
VSDLAFMRRALALAAAQAGRTGANPAVGCVIVKDGAVIAEAATADGGRPHAEEQALARVDARGATAYVTLEPCAMRTSGEAGCASLLVAAGVARVVIALRDPHPQGAGLAPLQTAGIAVEIGVGEAEARAINASFLQQWER